MIADGEMLKVCYGCGLALPVDQFRRRSGGSMARQGRCRSCHAAYMRGYRKARRSKQVRQFVAEVRRAESITRVASLVADVTTRFGGVDGFGQAWADEILAARPGSPTRLRSYLAIARMAETLEAHRPSDDVSQLTDAQIDQELRELLAKAKE